MDSLRTSIHNALHGAASRFRTSSVSSIKGYGYEDFSEDILSAEIQGAFGL
jgi:hypothetical protein